MCGTTPGSVCETCCSRLLGLPLIANGTTPNSTREVPCALKSLIRDGVHRKILGSFNEDGCQRHFFDWVENYRSPDPRIEEAELRMCPLMWCRKTFDSKESVISHVFECPRLSNAWYWCPYHRRPERYLECNRLCETMPKIRTRNREYKLHLADRFLHWICRKRFEKKPADFDDQTTLDGDSRPEYKEELSTGLDNQRFESPGSEPETSWTNDSPTTTGWIDENTRYSGDLSGMAKIGSDELALPELATHRSIVSPHHEMCYLSAARHEMYDSSYPTEMPVSISYQQRDSTKLRDPINIRSSRRSLGQKIDAMPALDLRYSNAEQLSNNLPGSTESDNTISSMARDTSKIDDVYAVSIPGIRNTITNSTPYMQSDRNSCAIFVETDILRESSDSYGAPTESSRVETIISSSPRPKSLDLSKPLPVLPQHKSLNLNRTLPSTPNSNNTQMSPTETSSSHRSSVFSRGHRLSSRTSASYPDARILENVPTDTSPDGVWMPLDLRTEFHGLRKPPLITSCSTDIDMMRAGNVSSKDLASLDKSKSPPLWNTIAPNALDSPASDAVSPYSPNSGLSSSFSNVLPAISPMNDVVFPPPTMVFPAIGTREGQDMGTIEHLEDAASHWIFPSPSPSESVMRELKYTRSASTPSDLGLPRQWRVSHTAISPTSGPQWTNDSVLKQNLHAFHDTHQFEELNALSFDTQPCLSKMNSSGLAPSVHSSGTEKPVGSEPPSSMMESLTARVATSFPSAPISARPISYTPIDSSFMNESMETVRVETPGPDFAPVDMNSDGHAPYDLPPIGGNAYSPFSLLYPLEGRHDAALSSRRQMIVPPLKIPRSNISSSGDNKGEASPRPRRSRATPSNLTSIQVSPQSQSREGQSSEILGAESDVSSAHQRQLDLPNALTSLPCTNTVPHCFDHRSLLVTHSTSKRRQVEELLELIRVINDKGMQRLESMPELWLRCNGQSPQALFEKAILTLRECLCGKFPQTFEEVFAFIRVAFAIAFLLYVQQSFYDFDAFYEDALKWHHAISDREDKKLFLRAMNCWYYLPERLSNALLDSSRWTSFDSIFLLEPLDCSGQTILLDVLRNGVAFKACSGFIDGFEEADICERNARFPAEALQLSTDAREYMIKHITCPLQHERGVEALQRILVDTELLIYRGFLRNTREVEVTLKNSARWSSESPEVLERFYDIVTSQCNRAMPSFGSDGYSSWRNAQYMVEVDKVLETLKEQDRLDSTELALIPGLDSSGFEVISPNQPVLDSPAPWSSISNRAMTLDSSPTNAMSWMSTGSSNRPDVSTGTSSLTALSQRPFSSTSLAPETPTTSVPSCLSCSKTFTGSLPDAKSNLQRHLRESRRHNKDAGRKCPLPECRLKPPMRSDNLRQHLQNFHKMSLSEANIIRDQIKSSARRVDNGGIVRPSSRRK